MLRFLRSLLAGGVATVADLSTLALFVSVLHVAPRVASVPALLAGAFVQFVGSRRFVFRSTDRRVARQAVAFAAVEIMAVLLNGALYDHAMRLVPSGTAHHGIFLLVRLVTSNVVYVAFSYPLWRLVFTESARRQTRPPSSAR